MPQGLSKTEQKRAVAVMLMQAAGNILEFWSERDDVEDIDPDLAQQWLAGWLKDLPGTQWDTRLGTHPYNTTKENRS
jgi:hypothetical protein